MKAVDVVTYVVSLYGKEKIEIGQTQGEKLMLLLASSNCPQFVHINNKMIAKSAIKLIDPKESWVAKPDDRGIDQRVRQTRELSEADEEIHNKYLKLVGGAPLLGDGSSPVE